MLTAGFLLENRYKIEKTLGSGGMGAVYLASDIRLPRQWAIKEMHDEFDTPEGRQQAEESFRAEATLLAQLDHPNLPRISDFFQFEGRHFLVMDFVEGQSLETRLDAGSLSFKEALDFGKQIAGVLEYLHSRPKPIVFRDLKPANIMIVDGKSIKLIDFGIARVLRPGASSDTRALGTPGYAAPEQYGRGQSDSRTDIYALGATLHHALSGDDPRDHPFQFAPFIEKRADVPAALERIVLRAVSLKPELRFQTASDFLQALETLEKDPHTSQLLPQRGQTSVLNSASVPEVAVTSPVVAVVDSPVTSVPTVAAPLSPDKVRFEPAGLHLGTLHYGHRAKALVKLVGKVEGKLVSSSSHVQILPKSVKGVDPTIEISFDSGRFPDGGHQWAEVTLKGKPDSVPALRVEAMCNPRKLQPWTYPVAFLWLCLSFLPIIGLVGSLALLFMLLGAPKSQSSGLRFFFWFSGFVSVCWLLLVAVGMSFSQFSFNF